MTESRYILPFVETRVSFKKFFVTRGKRTDPKVHVSCCPDLSLSCENLKKSVKFSSSKKDRKFPFFSERLEIIQLEGTYVSLESKI